MGKMFTISSPCQRTGKSVVAFMLSNYLNEMLDKSIKILVCCSNMNTNNILDLYNLKVNEIYLEDLVNARYLSDTDMTLDKIIAGNGRVSFIGNKKANSVFVDWNQSNYQKIIDEIKKQFGIVIVDTSGDECLLSYIFKKNSDCIINVLPQDTAILEGFYNIGPDKILNISIINMYQDIYPNKNDIAKLETTRRINYQKVFKTPYCSTLQHMKNKGNLDLYLQHDTEFNKNLKDLTNYIIKRYKLPVTIININNNSNSKGKRKTILSRIYRKLYSS